MTVPKILCLAISIISIIATLGVPSALAEGTEETPNAQHWTDTAIETVIQLGCKRGHRIEHYKGIANRQEILGPLWLTKPGEEGARGVVLPPFLRLYLYGRTQGCRRVDVAEARDLAAPEVWVALWRTEDPPNPFSDRTTSGQKVLRPKEVRLRADGAWHAPTSTRTRDRWVKAWYGADWNEKESLLAVFPALPHGGSLHADYALSEDGGSYLTESAIFSLVTMPEKWWAAAHTKPESPGEGNKP